jgi:hypothetical protein
VTGPAPPSSIVVSFFDRATDNKPELRSVTWERLAELLSAHVVRAKKDGPLFSPAVYAKGATRRNENVVELTLAVGDFDDGTAPETIRDHLRKLGLAFVI